MSVSIDDVPQRIVVGEGGNVEIITDKPTGCYGLKFDFGLNKVGGVMNICYELTTPYTVGPNQVCLFGGSETVSDLSICGPVCGDGACTQYVDYEGIVCVPMQVTPYATIGQGVVNCVGDPIITYGATECTGVENGTCFFTVSQTVHLGVPVTFGLNYKSGNVCVICEDAEGK